MNIKLTAAQDGGFRCCVCDELERNVVDMAIGPNGVYCIDCLRKAANDMTDEEARAYLGITHDERGREDGWE